MISPETMSGPSLEQALEWAQGITPRELSDAEALDLLPTPTATQPGGTAEQHLARKRGGKMNRTDPSVTDLRMALQSTDWAVYAKAIERHERYVAQRPAPAPLNDKRKLSAHFTEWMMGLEDGHVTGVPGLSRSQMIARLGNGVFPLQAATAYALLRSRFAAAAVPIAPPNYSTGQETTPK